MARTRSAPRSISSCRSSSEDINVEGLDISKETLEELLSVDKDLWLDDCKGIREFYKQVGDRVPAEFYEELAALESRLSK